MIAIFQELEFSVKSYGSWKFRRCEFVLVCQDVGVIGVIIGFGLLHAIYCWKAYDMYMIV